MRIARAPGGYVVSRTAPGRGAWLHVGCGALALRRGGVPRALRWNAGNRADLEELLRGVDAVESAWANPHPSH